VECSCQPQNAPSGIRRGRGRDQRETQPSAGPGRNGSHRNWCHPLAKLVRRNWCRNCATHNRNWCHPPKLAKLVPPTNREIEIRSFEIGATHQWCRNWCSRNWCQPKLVPPTNCAADGEIGEEQPKLVPPTNLAAVIGEAKLVPPTNLVGTGQCWCRPRPSWKLVLETGATHKLQEETGATQESSGDRQILVPAQAELVGSSSYLSPIEFPGETGRCQPGRIGRLWCRLWCHPRILRGAKASEIDATQASGGDRQILVPAQAELIGSSS
jgi:hypothetical protein